MMGVEMFSQEFFDKFGVDTLIEDLNMLRESVRSLEALENLTSYMQEDLDYDKFIIESLQNVLTYYIAHDEYEARVGIPRPRPFV